MDRWKYTNENVHITPKFLREVLMVVERELVKIFFLELNVRYDYEIEIKHFSETSMKSPHYWVRLKFFLEGQEKQKFTLMTLYCVDDFNYPVKIQANYLYDDFLEFKSENDFLEVLKMILKKCFLEMNSYIEFNNTNDELLNYNNDKFIESDKWIVANKRVETKSACANYFLEHDEQLVKKNTLKYTNRKKWTLEEKELIIDNIPSYRKELDKNDKESFREITNEFASKLLGKYNDIYEHRSVENLANRLAYFDELLAGVHTNYSRIDEIYFGKLKRLDGNTFKNPARKWRN
ncbi:hypothetical protein SAMN05443252_10424 [Bacillus sp. OV322]|uniref:hypothetical protein n=1 Tax=Bacillus sp. OV322 TaxID=1882764 RepID=UPI0008EC36DB|nr:hypothetical protein [Bacillus sp. OV322]SFC51070.1 hypothetical protein SAMN05443252_10424 [Bacillus sp. OV322]